MQFRDTALGFGLVTMINHWLGALLLPLFALLCFSTVFLSEEAKADRWASCLSLGLPLAVFFAFRLFWRFRHHHPLPLGSPSPLAVMVGRAIAIGLLLAGVILPLLLWLKLSAEGLSPLVFEIHLPTLLAPSLSLALVLSLLFWAGLCAFSLGFLLHLSAALKHQFILQDNAIARLLGKTIEL
ncbi:cytochrome b/b6 domain-containing protein [Rhodovibrionaceae bacterium A322]